VNVSDYILPSGFTISPVNSGFTYATPITCTVSTKQGVQPAAVLNSLNLFVQYGDGTETEITQVTDSAIVAPAHTYKWPGAYEVKLAVIPKDGSLLQSYSKTFSAFNYITDFMQWNYGQWPELTTVNRSHGAVFHGFQSCPPGPLYSATPLSFTFSVSNQLSSDVVFEVYADSSLSQPWEVVTPDNKFAQLRPRWRFTDTSGNVVTSISATNITPVYIKPDGTQTTAVNGILVGYYGTIDFYYIDDIPSLVYSTNTFTANLPTVWVTYNTSFVPNLQDRNDGSAPSYSNSNVLLSSYFYVKALSADHFNVTVNGGNIPLPKTLWADTDNQFIVTLNSPVLSSADFSNKVLLNYPLVGTTNSISATVAPASAATTFTPVFSLSRYDSINRDTGGFYKNILSTLPLSAVTQTTNVSASLVVGTYALTTINEPHVSYYSKANGLAGATTSVIAVSSVYNFDVVNYYNKYFVRKINENFNYGALLQSYMLQPFMADNVNLIGYLSAVGGDSFQYNENFGTLAYEKTANFVANNADPLNSGVDQLYSLAALVDTEFDNYNYNPPPVLKRQFDLYSTPHERLWGTREKYNTDFNNRGYHVNLGGTLSAYGISTTTVSAGQKIVVNDIFDSSFFELLEVPAINSYTSISANNMQMYFPPASSLTFPLTAYPLSAFYGWGLRTPVNGNYKFFVFNDEYTNTPVNNLIDWNTRTDGLSTTLTETASSVKDWYADGGILENIYSFYLTKGLNFIGSKYYQLTGTIPQS